MKKAKELIIRVTFEDNLVMMFGNSYSEWIEQFGEYARRWAKELKKPVKVETCKEKWIYFGGLKWCAVENFQHNLNREGRQHDESDNPNPRQYKDMYFNNGEKELDLALEAWIAGQRLMKINALNDEDYKLYDKGKLKIEVE